MVKIVGDVACDFFRVLLHMRQRPGTIHIVYPAMWGQCIHHLAHLLVEQQRDVCCVTITGVHLNRKFKPVRSGTRLLSPRGTDYIFILIATDSRMVGCLPLRPH